MRKVRRILIMEKGGGRKIGKETFEKQRGPKWSE